MGLSKRHMEIFERIKGVLEKGESVPTVAMLGKEFNMTQQAMSKNLKVLEREGLIKRDRSRHRSMELVEPPPLAVRVPLLGKIAAGQPLEAIESTEEIEVPADMVPAGEAYALEVCGDSMIDDGILEGDVVVVRRQSMAFDGQTVVAIINGEATLKRYYHEGSRIRLQPANERLKPFYAGPDDNFEIRGIVHALFRQFPVN